MRIGILSDSHLPSLARDFGDLGPEPASFFSGLDLILHSGDVTALSVIDWLEQFAPVMCAVGNNDPILDSRFDLVQQLDIMGWRIGMVHSLVPESRPVHELQRHFPSPVDVMIAGHTHHEKLDHRDGALLLNSGSITYPRNKDLRLGTVGLLELAQDRLRAEIVVLGHTSGRPNPGEAMSMEIQRGVPAPGGPFTRHLHQILRRPSAEGLLRMTTWGQLVQEGGADGFR